MLTKNGLMLTKKHKKNAYQKYLIQNNKINLVSKNSQKRMHT